jgi:hypothetical protein
MIYPHTVTLRITEEKNIELRNAMGIKIMVDDVYGPLDQLIALIIHAIEKGEDHIYLATDREFNETRT